MAELVAEWIEEEGLAPGPWVAGTSSDLYWVWLAWLSRRYPGSERPGHWPFAIELRRAGLGRKKQCGRQRMRVLAHLLSQASANKMLAQRAALGLRPRLNWALSEIPQEYKTRRTPETQDEAYRRRKRSDRAALNRRAAAAVGARQAASAGLLVQPR